MHKLTDSLVALAGCAFGAVGTAAPDTIVQLISAISSLACLAFALVRAAIRTVDTIREHRKGKKTAEELLDDLRNIEEEFKGGSGKEKR